MVKYRDNYPFNVEAPQRVYIQYSQDVNFDYSTGKFPTGETHEGFIWENVYIPVPHYVGVTLIGRHVWMRLRIGEKEAWTYPIRITDGFANISAIDVEELPSNDAVKYRFKYTLYSGEIVYSEFVTVPNGSDGIGIVKTEIIGDNLVITYSNGVVENVGRVVGFDGIGVPQGAANGSYLTSVDGIPEWDLVVNLLDNNLSAVSPLVYDSREISHLNTDGNRHIPIGGNNLDCLVTDGAGNYSWEPRIITIPINDSAGIGDTDELWSADKIATTFANLQTFGIKYSVDTYVELLAIADMEINDLAVVIADPLYPNRPVFKYDGVDWIAFFDLDSTHNHNDLYYTKTELNTPNGGGNVDWTNISNAPDFMTGFIIHNLDSPPPGTIDVQENSIIHIVCTGNISVDPDVDTLRFNVPPYTAGSGILIWDDTEIHHANTSDVANTNNSAGIVIQNLTFDAFGHVTGVVTRDLDTRYLNLSYLTAGAGLSGASYNGMNAVTWAVSYAGSGDIPGTGGLQSYGVSNNVARSDHYHHEVSNANFNITGSPVFVSVARKIAFPSMRIVTVDLSAYWSGGITLNYDTYLGTIPTGFRPMTTFSALVILTDSGGVRQSVEVFVFDTGESGRQGHIRIGRFSNISFPAGTIRYLTGSLTFYCNE